MGGGSCDGNAHSSIHVAANHRAWIAPFVHKEGRDTLEENLGFLSNLAVGGDDEWGEVIVRYLDFFLYPCLRGALSGRWWR
jgi:hypothetical protein